MDDDLEVKFAQSPDGIKINCDLVEIKKELLNKYAEYHKKIQMLSCDVPISVLCLPKHIEKKLHAHGCFRVCDMLDLDFTKIEGLTDSAIRLLTASFDKFIAM